MAVQFKTSGTVLFSASGVAMAAACCCEPACTPCCEGFANATLYLSIDTLTFDGGETCDDACVPDINAEASTDTGGGETACGNVSANWFIAPVGAGTAELSTLECDGSGDWIYASQGILVSDGDGGVCDILLDPNPQTLTGATCDPFYWEGDLTVAVYNDGEGTPCGTGTIHVIITE